MREEVKKLREQREQELKREVKKLKEQRENNKGDERVVRCTM